MHGRAVPKDLFDCWQHTLVHWAQRPAHDMLLGEAVKHQQLAWLAARYRDAARSNPHDPVARDRMKSVQRAAAMLTFTTTVPRETGRTKARGGSMLLVAVVLFTGLGLWLTDMMRLQQRAPVVSRHP